MWGKDGLRHDAALAETGAKPVTGTLQTQTSTQGTPSPGLDVTAPGQGTLSVRDKSEIRAAP
ncbi:Hypothetical protein AA314_06489 [Archangium gephyra]|uniref:Uncharacterized protein n=1 Tax=Archangium gephyra TaxID=48 RepID=A0AAC8QC08_9BACT|nr:Hypothetical protein AA314_06489 [Archangium gephyra]